MASALRLTLLTSFAVASAAAQSGSPALMTPLANPDPRLAAIHAAGNNTRSIGSAAISPDGTLVAYTVGRGAGGRGAGEAAGFPIVLAPVAAHEQSVEKLISGSDSTHCSNSAPVFSPDSQSLAYTSTCTSKEDKPGDPQIFLYSRATGTSTQLSHLKGIFQQVAFAPDGKSLAFLFVENATRSAGALAAMKPWAGVIGEDGVEIQRIATVAVPTGAFSYLTPANLHAYEFGWAPDSSGITYVAANPPGENNWWVAKLYTQPIAAAPRVVFDPNTTKSALHGLQIAVPRWSSDGRKIAFIGGLMSDQGSTGGDVWVVDSKGGEPTDITPSIDGTPTYLSWTGPNNIGFIEDKSGHTHIRDYVVSTHTADFDQDLGEVTVSGGPIKNAISVSNTGTLALVEQGHALAPELFVGPSDNLKQFTHLNDGAKSTARTESVEWSSPVQPGGAQNFHVQGWLTYPVNFDPKKKYPLIVSVHGGPSASAGATFAGPVWAQLGYFVLAPNPRGSFGQGEAFTAANRKDFGYGDLRDIEAGMDSIEAKIPAIDKHREGLMGWSYGGFMTMFGVTQTTRFRAAVAGAGLSDWLSYYGENSIDQWMVPFFGATVYDDPAVYAKSSAITFIKNVKTPTLVVVGDRDGECPAPQSFEFWHALRAEGVKTQLVVFPNEGHGFRDPAHIRDLEARQAAWFAENMPAQ